MAFGAERGPAASLPTDFTYATGRGLGVGLTPMGARWLDAKLAMWGSADTLVPSAANPQSLNRYSHVSNNPLGRIDPGGHCDESLDYDQREQDHCWQQFSYLRDTYGIYFDSTVWGIEDPHRLRDMFEALEQAISQEAVRTIFKGIWIRVADPSEKESYEWDDLHFYRRHTMYLYAGFGSSRGNKSGDEIAAGVSGPIHEMWHHIEAWASVNVYGWPSTNYAADFEYGAARGPDLDLAEYAQGDVACLHRNGCYSENLAYAGTRYIFELGATMTGSIGPWGGGYDYSNYARANYPNNEDWGRARARLTALITDIRDVFKYRY